MDIKNISQILKANLPLSTKLFAGSTLNGKILSNENGKGAIKLYDGTIIPAIFISENDIEKDKYIKFIVQSFDDDNFILKVLGENENTKSEKSLNTIIRDLNIPFEEGKNIILSLIKYNIPATNENINNLHKNTEFLNNIKNMNDSEILLFLRQHVNEEITQDSPEFELAKTMFSELKDVTLDFLSFMLENDIPQNPINMLKTQNFMKNKFFFNSFIHNIKSSIDNINTSVKEKLSNDDTFSNMDKDIKNVLSNIVNNNTEASSASPASSATDNNTNNILSKYEKLLGAKPSDTEKLIINSVIKSISDKIGLNTKNIVVKSFEETINILKRNEEMFSFISSESYNKFLDNLDIFKQINNNYNLYFFNLYDGSNFFKNNIIIKNKYKGSKHIDINDVKAFISVDTKNLGKVEGNLYKKNNDISISFSVNEEFVSLFKSNISSLKNTLKEYGYDLINISVEKCSKEKNILPFSDFFNDLVLRELDVKV